MLVRSALIIGRNVAQRKVQLPTNTIRTIISSQSLKQQSQSQDGSFWIEDNLKLDIKDMPDATHVEAIPVETGREGKLIKQDHPQACTLCRLNLRNLEYTDVMILSQYIKRNGSVVTYHESKLCRKQYTKVLRLIKKAQRCNLIQRPPDYLIPGAWHDLNTYMESDRKRDQPMKVVKKEYWKM